MSRDKINRATKALVHWSEIIDDIEQLRQEYEEAGWETAALHPGDVAAGDVTDEGVGFSLVVPESEFEALERLVSDGDPTYDEFEAYRAPADDLDVYVVVLKSTASRRSILLPLFYDSTNETKIADSIQSNSSIHIEITMIGSDSKYIFTIEESRIFAG
jgi:hypothetical protein